MERMEHMESNRCKYVFKRGKYKHERCTTTVKNGADMCSKHNKSSKAAETKEEQSNLDCSICMESIMANNKYYLPCGHVFHKNCIATWLDLNESCPMCRAKYEPVRAAPPPIELPPPFPQVFEALPKCAYPEVNRGGFIRCTNEACYGMPYCATHAYFILEYAYGEDYARAYAWDAREFA